MYLPGKSHGQRSLVGYSPWGHKESDTTERLHFLVYSYEHPFLPYLHINIELFVVQLLSRVWLFATPRTAALQASQSFTISQSLPKLMSIKSAMPLNYFILCCSFLLLPSLFPSIRSFPMSWLFASGGQSIGASVSAIILPMNIQGWLILGLTGLISLQSKGLSRVFSNTTVQRAYFSGAQLSLWSNSHICTWLLENHIFNYKDLCRQSNISAF